MNPDPLYVPELEPDPPRQLPRWVGWLPLLLVVAVALVAAVARTFGGGW